MTIQQTDERNFRLQKLADFIGQAEVKKTLRLMLDAAQKRGSVLEHVIFFGPPGLGKTTLAAIIAAEMNGRLFELSASSVKKAGDLASVLAKVQRNDVVFLDEIHALGRDVAEILYSAMEEWTGEDGEKRSTLVIYASEIKPAETSDAAAEEEPQP